MPRLVECGDDEFEGLSENPVVRRLRHRRLLAFLWLQGMEATFGSMVHETDAFFSVAHLQSEVKQGQWRDAIAYLSRFLPPLVDGGDRLPSLEAQVLHHFLAAHKTLADILAGAITEEAHALSGYFCKYRDNESSTCNGTLRLRGIMVTTLRAKQHLRFFLDWERMRHRAAKIAYSLVRRTPEMKRAMLLPGGPMKPRNVLPIRTCTGRRSRRKKHPYRQQAPTLAKHYLQRRGRLFYSSHSKESANELHDKAASWIADILDECFKAGKPLKLHQKSTIQTSGNQVARSNLILPDRLGTWIAHARNVVATIAREADESLEAGKPLELHQHLNTCQGLRQRATDTFESMTHIEGGCFQPNPAASADSDRAKRARLTPVVGHLQKMKGYATCAVRCMMELGLIYFSQGRQEDGFQNLVVTLSGLLLAISKNAVLAAHTDASSELLQDLLKKDIANVSSDAMGKLNGFSTSYFTHAKDRRKFDEVSNLLFKIQNLATLTETLVPASLVPTSDVSASILNRLPEVRDGVIFRSSLTDVEADDNQSQRKNPDTAVQPSGTI